MEKSDIRAAAEAYADAWRSGDLARTMALYPQDFTLHYGGANRLSGTHRGKPAALKALAAFGAATKRRLVEIVDVTTGAARAVIIARERFETPDGPIEMERVLVYRVEDGALHECWLYDSDQVLIDRLIGKSTFVLD